MVLEAHWRHGYIHSMATGAWKSSNALHIVSHVMYGVLVFSQQTALLILSVLQKMFMSDMALLNQNYMCLWTTEQIDEFIKTLPK